MTRHASTLYLPPTALLAVGITMTVLTGPRWGITPLAWLAPVPYLLWARQSAGRAAWGWLFWALLTGYAVQCAIFATTPVPVIGVIGFAPPLALLRFLPITLAEAVRRRQGEAAGIVTYIAATVTADWSGYGLTEFGAWMATANSQVEWLSFMQIVSVTGLAGAGALMAWMAGAVAMAVAAPRSTWLPQERALVVTMPAVAVAAVVGWGGLRLDAPVGGRTVGVAAVVTDLGLSEKGLPDADALRANTDLLFQRTRTAAARGARLVVWNEIATVINPEEEEAFTERARKVAVDLRIDLVVAYGVLERTQPLLFDNKYLFISDEGAVLDEYRKHHPVPGEPSIRGTEPIRVLDRPYGRVGGAICYDYDFPALAREHARLSADLVVVPSSDWRGIDPIHTYMARTRAIENGFALVRAVRWAPSGAFDRFGRTRAWMTAVDDTEGVMVTHLPIGGSPTTAALLGDVPVYAAIVVVLVAVAGAFVPRRIRHRAVAATAGLMVIAAAAPAAAQTSASPGRWSVDVMGGWSTGASLKSGHTTVAMPAGVPFTTSTGSPSRANASWWLGDGTTLFRQAAQRFGELQGRTLATITGLDSEVNRLAGTRAQGGQVGLRVGYRLSPEWQLGIEGELGRALTFSDDAMATFERSRESFVTAWADMLGPAPISNLNVTAALARTEAPREFRLMGTASRTLKHIGRVAIAATAGAGIGIRHGSPASITLDGRYGFLVNTGGAIEERDRVTVALAQRKAVPVAAFGGTFTWATTASSGFRLEARILLTADRTDTIVDAAPELRSANGALLASLTVPGLQFSAQPNHRSSLSGAPLSLTTSSSSGTTVRWQIGLGYGVRF